MMAEMTTPICDFVDRYIEASPLRLHMPGHKGIALPGSLSDLFARDITEIAGADSLFEASGIIRESEENASSLFASSTFYSTEGSSLCIRAMLYLALLYAREIGRSPRILAGRNAHKTLVSGAALLGLDVDWLLPTRGGSYLSCTTTAEEVAAILDSAPEKPIALFLTSPDYLGNTLDLTSIAEACHAREVLLLVDNAHGAYLRFLPVSRHPIDLGADLVCDSAHKTLPALTGGAYLHLSSALPPLFASEARTALSLFASTSPSYLILQSLDALNRYLAQDYRGALAEFLPALDRTRAELSALGYSLSGNEPMKLTILPKPYGYTGQALAEILREKRIECEFADPDFLVLMLTPETRETGLSRLLSALAEIPQRTAITTPPPTFSLPEAALPIREAVLSPRETVPVEHSLGRILALTTVGCPPAVPIVVSGERIGPQAIAAFRYYGITSCTVVKE